MKKYADKFRSSPLKAQVIIFLALFVLVELLLRVFGFRAGTSIDDFVPVDHPVYQPRMVSDERGMNYIKVLDTNLLLPGAFINGAGFRSQIPYTPAAMDSLRRTTGKEIIMMIGDSFVEGCCPDSVVHSFPDLISSHGRYNILNFGVAGTDPLQYRLVAEKYIPLLRPDRVVVVSYFGNDILVYERKATPGIPEVYPFEKNKWLSPVAENYISDKLNYKFKTADEAYTFYMDHYTLKGKSRNAFEKSISYSVILSKIYLAVERRVKRHYWMKQYRYVKTVDAYAQAYHEFHAIAKLCDSLKTPCLFAGIPEPKEADDVPALKIKYQPLFHEIPWSVPENFSTDDYTGRIMASHYNTQGHKKYAAFLEQLLDAQDKKRK